MLEQETAPTAAAATAPARDDQDESVRILAEAFYEQGVREVVDIPSTTREDLLAAGDAMCDAWDRGDSLQSVLALGASLLPEVSTTEDITLIAGTAAGTLCPEHAAS